MTERCRTGWVLALSAPLAAACGGATPAEAVRPDAPTASSALEEEAECRGVEKGGEPLIVDWKPEHRGDLEVAMKDGVAVLAYSCEGIKLLPDCKIDGEYGYIGMTTREQVVRLRNADEVRANLPFSGAKIGGELERGASLDIAMMIVGKKRTTWDAPTKADLKGSCDGATHFVRGAIVGAFAMSTGSGAKARAAAEIFGASAGASSTSSKQTSSRDGDVADCKKATPDSDKAPPQCGAPIRLVLAPISASAEEATSAGPAPAPGVAEAETRECPEGMVFSEGKCTTPAAAKGYECDGRDMAECQKQCEAGSAASCGVFGASRAEANDYGAAAPPLRKGCEGGHARSCANLGILMARGLGMGQDVAAAVPLFQKACDGGDAVGCRELGRNYLLGSAPLAKDEAKAATLFLRACEGGDNQGCAFYASAAKDGLGMPRDLAKATHFHRRACHGGLAGACAELGLAHESGAGAPKVEALARSAYERGCYRGSAAACTGLGRIEFVKGNTDAAKRHFERACLGRDDLACASLKLLFGSPKAVIPGVSLLQELGTGCRAGSALDCGSAGLLDVARGNSVGGKASLEAACGRGDAFSCAVVKKLP